MPNLVLPRIQAMLVCEGVEESEHEFGVYHLTGVRTAIESPFPAVVARLCVFSQMSGHKGAAQCHIEIERVDSNDLVFATAPQPVWFDGPTSIVSVVFPLDNCVFPAPGLYYVQIHNEGKLIGERPFELRQED